MRGLVLVLAACGGAAAPVVQPTSIAPSRAPTKQVDVVAQDPVAALAPPLANAEVSWIAPGQARITLDATPIEAPERLEPVPVSVIDEQGSLVRVAVRLDHARFSLWMERARMYRVIVEQTRVRTNARPTEPSPLLFVGARVQELERSGERVRIRYVGALEIEGWIALRALGDRGPQHPNGGRMPSGGRTLTLMPGSIIRAAATQLAAPIALSANGYFVDQLREVDDRWLEVRYRDGDIDVQGFYQRFSPPGPTHRTQRSSEALPVPIAANAKVRDGTCLYTRASGEPVGYIVGQRDVALDEMTNGWWSLAIDTPWGPITFAARGPTSGELVTCP